MNAIGPDRCPACGELLDASESATCRTCGEVLDADADPEGDEISTAGVHFDRLGTWSAVKHQILESYAKSYTTILKSKNQSFIKRVVYIDGFAGPGIARSRDTDDYVLGSPSRILDVVPPFDELHFIEMNDEKRWFLEELVGRDQRVHVHAGDCNDILLRNILPRCRYEDFARGLCLLDPYGLSVRWDVLAAIARTKSIEIFFNFMVVGANRNVLWNDPNRVSPERKVLMTNCWGDEKWTDELYDTETDLFGEVKQKRSNHEVAEAYRRRLQKVAGFKYVPEPIPIKNSRNATIYYLFFASPNLTGARIVEDVFRKFRQ